MSFLISSSPEENSIPSFNDPNSNNNDFEVISSEDDLIKKSENKHNLIIKLVLSTPYC